MSSKSRAGLPTHSITLMKPYFFRLLIDWTISECSLYFGTQHNSSLFFSLNFRGGGGVQRHKFPRGLGGSWDAPVPEGKETWKNWKQCTIDPKQEVILTEAVLTIKNKQICWPKCQILRLWVVWNFGTSDLHIHVCRKLHVSLASVNITPFSILSMWTFLLNTNVV